jgi:hypothetical protein
MYKKLILKNDFHNTQAVFRIQHSGEIEVNDIINLSASQVKKAKRLLCYDDCQCSGELGTRADWHELNGQEIKISYDIQHDNYTGQITGGKIYIEKIWK